MQISDTDLEGVKILTPGRFGDDRGYFSEIWNYRVLRDLGLDVEFVQDNHSLSRDVGTVRGLHFQAPPHAQDKLVRVGRGCVLDVAVDIRKGSTSFGKWVAVELSAENGRQLFIPKGFLHGFVTRVAETEVYYKCSDYYAPDCEGAIRFDDPDLAVNWGIDAALAVLSAKDAVADGFRDFKSPFDVEARS